MLLKYLYGAHLYFIFGIFIGITLCLIFSYTDCDFENNYDFNRIEKLEDEYEPVINLAGKPMKAHKTPQSIIRPRYYSTELGIREKLFVAVLTNKKNILNTGISFNRTVGHIVDKLMFFIESIGPEKLNISLPGVVGFTDSRTILRPFHTIKYITDTFLEEYDYFFLVNDFTYINARKLKEITNQISVSQEVHLGSLLKENNPIYCSLDAGILLSNSLLKKIKLNLEWCVKHAYSDNDNDNLGRCILHSTDIPCKSSAQGQVIESYLIKSEKELKQNMEYISKFKNVISYYPLQNSLLFYQLHSSLAKNYIIEKEKAINELRHSIKEHNIKGPNPNESLVWPLGNRPGNKPGNRFDIIRWDYFTENHIYLSDDFHNIKKLEGSEKTDISYIINVAVKKLETDYGNRIKYLRLINGYKRMDPSRGMEYKLDLAFKDNLSGFEIHKRMEICKPLGAVELIPMPYVTENSRINLILPIIPSQIEEAKIFIDNYSKICMDKHEKTFLILVLIYGSLTPGKGFIDDIYLDIKTLANSLSEKHKKDGRKIIWVSIKLPESISEDEPIVDLALADLATKKLTPESLILICQVNMELRLDYLNRVRMNTILKHQVFSPIPFSEFKPEIVYNDELTRPAQLDINKNYGHYRSEYTKIISFYLYDYITARKNIENILPIVQNDRDVELLFIKSIPVMKEYLPNTFYSLFLRNSNIHILRAVDPGLRLRYLPSTCVIKDNVMRQNCLDSQALNLGTRSQLAKLILDYMKN